MFVPEVVSLSETDVPTQLPEEELFVIQKLLVESFRRVEGRLPQLLVSVENEEGNTVIFEQQLLPVAFIEAKHTKFQEKAASGISPLEVVSSVASSFGLDATEIIGRSKSARVKQGRKVAIYILRDTLNLSYSSIGEILGGRHHTTILNSMKRSEEEIKDPESDMVTLLDSLRLDECGLETVSSSNRLNKEDESSLTDKLVVLGADGLAVCPVKRVADLPISTFFDRNSGLVIDWQLAATQDELYSKFADIAYKKLQSLLA